MAEMKISNTLKNDTEEGILAYVQQLKDTSIDWSAYTKVSKDFKMDDSNRFQHKLNDFFLKHYDEFHSFLEDKGVEGVIDTWKDIEDFVAEITDSETMRLVTLIRDTQLYQINVRMSTEVPGMLKVVTTSGYVSTEQTTMDIETGALRVVFDFDIEEHYDDSSSDSE